MKHKRIPMWLVVDSNQARRIPASFRRGLVTSRAKGLTLPPYLLAETLLRGAGPRRDTLAALQQHDVRIGVEPVAIMDVVAQMQANQIPKFEPFPAPGSDVDTLHRLLLKEDRAMLSPEAERWARSSKANHLAMAADFIGRAKSARRKLKDGRAGKAASFAEVLPLAEGPQSFVGSLVISSISNGGKRAVRETDPARLHRAAMKNPFLRHFFLGILFYVISISRAWTTQTLNRDPLATRDDWADLTLGFYVGAADVVVSADALLRDLFTAIDPTIRLVTAVDL